jgi:lipopolysaccharide transport system permease protein
LRSSAVARRGRALPTRVHSPRHPLDFGVLSLWRYRRVILHFGWVFVMRKLRGTWLGWMWIPLRPTLDMLARALLFGGFLQVGSGDRPYLIFLMVGSTAWIFFDRAAYWGFRSAQIHGRALARSQIPRLTAIVAALIAGAVDALLYASIAMVTALYFKLTRGSFYVTISGATALSLLGLVLLALYAVAIGALFTSFVRKVPDVRFLFGYTLSFWYFVTPVLYPATQLPEKYRLLVEYNPLTAPVELFKFGLLGTNAPTSRSVVVCLVGLTVLLSAALVVLTRAERKEHAAL